MLLEQYKEKGCLFNMNLSGTTDTGEVYRGDLVLEFGEITERGDMGPPKTVINQAVLLTVEDKTVLLAGGLDELADLETVIKNYDADYADGAIGLFFVHNIKDPMTVKLGSVNYILVPLDDGMIWNEILELLFIEKSDIKRQSAEEKVVTLYEELGTYKHKFPAVEFETALTQTVTPKTAVRGAV